MMAPPNKQEGMPMPPRLQKEIAAVLEKRTRHMRSGSDGWVLLKTKRDEKTMRLALTMRAANHAEQYVGDITHRVVTRWFETIDPGSAKTRKSTSQYRLAIAMRATIDGRKAAFGWDGSIKKLRVSMGRNMAEFDNTNDFDQVDRFFVMLKALAEQLPRPQIAGRLAPPVHQ
jgi:hypothetical protein